LAKSRQPSAALALSTLQLPGNRFCLPQYAQHVQPCHFLDLFLGVTRLISSASNAG
jgi:hypothetical protein